MFGFDGELTTAEIVGTCISLVVSVLRILSFQIKPLKQLMLFQATTSTIYAIAFLFLGGYQGAAQNLLSAALRIISVFGDRRWARSKVWVWVFSAAYVGFGLLFVRREGWVAILTSVAMISYVIVLWMRDAHKFKLNYLCTTAPAWIIYDIAVKNYPGAATETFNMVSIIIYFLRLRRRKKATI